MMHTAATPKIFLLTALMLLTGGASGSSVVFEKVELFEKKVLFTETLHIDTAGAYQATLTDFEFPKPLKKMGLNISTSKDTLGSVFAPGSFDFEADAGTYYVNFFAEAGKKKNKNKQKNRGKNKEHRAHKKGESANRKHGEKKHRARKPDKQKPNKGHERDNHPRTLDHGMTALGQYGIEIAYLDGLDSGLPPFHPTDPGTVVPVPAAAWLFGSGLLTMMGINIRRGANRRRSLSA